MPTLWEASTKRGKASLIIMARELGMLHYDPDHATHLIRRIELIVKDSPESPEDVSRIMTMTPSQVKERLGE